MSLLTIIQNVTDEIGLPRPSSVINNSDATVRQLLALANRSGKNHAKAVAFEVLTKEASFDTVATEEQGALTTIAADFDRFISRTMQDRTNTWIVHGPVSAQEWQERKTSQITGGLRNVFRIRGGKILFNPVPAAGNDIYFEYLSKHWCSSSDGATGRTAFAADTDIGVIDEELITLDVKWRFLKAKGLDYAEDFRDWNTYLNQLLGYDGAKDVLRADGERQLTIEPSVPDGSWNV